MIHASALTPGGQSRSLRHAWSSSGPRTSPWASDARCVSRARWGACSLCGPDQRSMLRIFPDKGGGAATAPSPYGRLSDYLRQGSDCGSIQRCVNRDHRAGRRGMPRVMTRARPDSFERLGERSMAPMMSLAPKRKMPSRRRSKRSRLGQRQKRSPSGLGSSHEARRASCSERAAFPTNVDCAVNRSVALEAGRSLESSELSPSTSQSGPVAPRRSQRRS